jgi:hypothetical protein
MTSMHIVQSLVEAPMDDALGCYVVYFVNRVVWELCCNIWRGLLCRIWHQSCSILGRPDLRRTLLPPGPPHTGKARSKEGHCKRQKGSWAGQKGVQLQHTKTKCSMERFNKDISLSFLLALCSKNTLQLYSFSLSKSLWNCFSRQMMPVVREMCTDVPIILRAEIPGNMPWSL